MPITDGGDNSIVPILEALADTGECVDLSDVETQLLARGYPASVTRLALSDPDLRRAVTRRCVNARALKLRSRMVDPARLDPSALYRKPFGRS